MFLRFRGSMRSHACHVFCYSPLGSILALGSCYVLDLKRVNFGKSVSLSVRSRRTQDSAGGSRGNMGKDQSLGSGVKSRAKGESKPHLLSFYLLGLQFPLCERKNKTCRWKVFAHRGR